MLKFGNKEFRNLQEQVLENMKNIKDIHEGTAVLGEFGIKVVGEVDSLAELPSVAEYKIAHPEWEYGDAFAVGTQAPYSLYILTRGNDAITEDHWFNIGIFPAPGPQGEQGEAGSIGPQGPQGNSGPTGSPAGFGTVVASATTLPAGSAATVAVSASGPNTAKEFAFSFGIPRGSDGSSPVWGNIIGTMSDQTDLKNALDAKQDTLVSGTNIKTINNQSVVGSGNIEINSGVWGNITGTLSDQTDLKNALDAKQDVIDASHKLPASNVSGLANVATSGSYEDLSNKPTIPAAQVNSDWSAVSGVAQILNKPNLATVATSGNYNDLSNKPALGSLADQDTVNYATEVTNKPDLSIYAQSANLATVATTGAYSDLSGKPTLGSLADQDTVDYATEVTNKPDLSVYATTSAMDTALANKQDKLIAGDDIEIASNEIQTIYGGGITTSSESFTDSEVVCANLESSLVRFAIYPENENYNDLISWAEQYVRPSSVNDTKNNFTVSFTVTDDNENTFTYTANMCHYLNDRYGSYIKNNDNTGYDVPLSLYTIGFEGGSKRIRITLRGTGLSSWNLTRYHGYISSFSITRLDTPLPINNEFISSDIARTSELNSLANIVAVKQDNLITNDDITITNNEISTVYGGMLVESQPEVPLLPWAENYAGTYQYNLDDDTGTISEEEVTKLGKYWHAALNGNKIDIDDTVNLIITLYDDNQDQIGSVSANGVVNANTFNQNSYYVRITSLNCADLPAINYTGFRINTNYNSIVAFDGLASQLVYDTTNVAFVKIELYCSDLPIYGPIYDKYVPIDDNTLKYTQNSFYGNGRIAVKDIPDNILDNKTIIRDTDNKLSTAVGGYIVEVPAKHYETHVMTWQEGTYGYQYQCSPSFGDLTLSEAEADYHEFEGMLTGTDTYRTTEITSGLTLQLSTDNVNWDSYDATCTASAGTNLEAGYFRFRYLTVADLSISSKESRIYAQTSNTQEYLNIDQQVDANQTPYLYAKLVYDQASVDEIHYIDSDYINIDGTTILRDSGGILSAAIPTNYVTTDTTQTISATKTFSDSYEDNIVINTPHNQSHNIIISGDGGDYINTLSAQNISIKNHSQHFFRINNNRTFSVGATEDGTLATLTLPTTTGTLALTSQIPDMSNVVTTNTTQTIAGAKTFTNDFTVNLESDPSAGGTVDTETEVFRIHDVGDNTDLIRCESLDEDGENSVIISTDNFKWGTKTVATLNDIPTNADYVDLTTNQTITGVKTINSGSIEYIAPQYSNLKIRLANSAGSSANGIALADYNNTNVIEFIVRPSMHRITPSTDNDVDLGLANQYNNQRFKNLYLAGDLSDGTNSISIANIASKSDIPTYYKHCIRFQATNTTGNIFIINTSNTQFTTTSLITYLSGLTANTPVEANAVYNGKPIIYARSTSTGIALFYVDTDSSTTSQVVTSFTNLADVVMQIQ